MDEKDIAALQNAEIDYEDIIDRFEGNESLYLKLAELFLDDPHMPNVRRAFAAGDLATAEAEAHALKGVAGNLSLTSVHKLAKSMNDALTYDYIVSMCNKSLYCKATVTHTQRICDNRPANSHTARVTNTENARKDDSLVHEAP
ncbi:Hpt domain-containing protein [Senegalimassilia anaerobia]|uniref:Hpt domain-containing protein n=1 Tax=Senegalimassilia anaerobia TaxID=1473216 RepID=UPI003A8F3DE4